jgi:hypothetical protein
VPIHLSEAWYRLQWKSQWMYGYGKCRTWPHVTCVAPSQVFYVRDFPTSSTLQHYFCAGAQGLADLPSCTFCTHVGNAYSFQPWKSQSVIACCCRIHYNTRSSIFAYLLILHQMLFILEWCVQNEICRSVHSYKLVQIWPGRFVCKQVTVCRGHIWTTLYYLDIRV